MSKSMALSIDWDYIRKKHRDLLHCLINIAGRHESLNSFVPHTSICTLTVNNERAAHLLFAIQLCVCMRNSST